MNQRRYSAAGKESTLFSFFLSNNIKKEFLWTKVLRMTIKINNGVILSCSEESQPYKSFEKTLKNGIFHFATG